MLRGSAITFAFGFLSYMDNMLIHVRGKVSVSNTSGELKSGFQKGNVKITVLQPWGRDHNEVVKPQLWCDGNLEEQNRLKTTGLEQYQVEEEESGIPLSEIVPQTCLGFWQLG